MFDVDRQEVKRSYFEVHQLARLLRFLTLQIESYLIRVQFLALDQLLSCLLGVKIQVVAVTAIEKEVIFVSNNDIVRVLRFKTNLHRQIQTLVYYNNQNNSICSYLNLIKYASAYCFKQDSTFFGLTSDFLTALRVLVLRVVLLT